MKRLEMAPYPGMILLTRDRKEYYRTYKRMTGEEYPYGSAIGSTVQLGKLDAQRRIVFLVHAPNDTATLAHEFSHAILDLFKHIGLDPLGASGEPFCYMLSHLMEEARKK